MQSAFGVDHDVEKRLPMPPKKLNAVMTHPAFMRAQSSLSHNATGDVSDMAYGVANALRPRAKTVVGAVKQRGVLKPRIPRVA